MQLRAFKAYRFNKDKVGNPADCVAPPYDVIDNGQRDQLLKKSSYNIVRIIRPTSEPTDSEKQNQYTRAATLLTKWINEQALLSDHTETIYAYVQDFTVAAKAYQRLSFIAQGKLEPLGKTVRGHENTLSGPKVDRLNLTRATKAAFGLVFMLYDDKNLVAEKIVQQTLTSKPLIDLTDDQQVRHRLFALTDPSDIEAISQMMADKSCVIADGHHRYETGLNYAKENPAAGYQMMAFSNIRHEGLIVLATHRLIHDVENFSLPDLLEKLAADFEITEFTFDTPSRKTDARQQMIEAMQQQFENSKNAFGIYAATGSFYIAVLKNLSAINDWAPDKSEPWRHLDVSILHKLILEKHLGIDEQKLAQYSNVQYVKDTPSAIDNSIDHVDTGNIQAAFFMNPPKLEQIQDVAEHGEKMPQKSTYFYPKVFTGLTINKF